jgi:hypothetical protein
VYRKGESASQGRAEDRALQEAIDRKREQSHAADDQWCA